MIAPGAHQRSRDRLRQDGWVLDIMSLQWSRRPHDVLRAPTNRRRQRERCKASRRAQKRLLRKVE